MGRGSCPFHIPSRDRVSLPFGSTSLRAEGVDVGAARVRHFTDVRWTARITKKRSTT